MLGVRRSSPLLFWDTPKPHITKGKTLFICTLKRRVLVLKSYPNPHLPPLFKILYPPQLHPTSPPKMLLNVNHSLQPAQISLQVPIACTSVVYIPPSGSFLTWPFRSLLLLRLDASLLQTFLTSLQPISK